MNYDILYDEKCVYRIQAKDVVELKTYFNKKGGWVYIAKSKSSPHLKIGRTGKNPMERAKTLSSTGVLHDYEIVFSTKVFNQFWAEKVIHNKLKRFRVSKEFFSVQDALAIEVFHSTYEEEQNLLKRFINLEIIKDDLDLIEHALL